MSKASVNAVLTTIGNGLAASGNDHAELMDDARREVSRIMDGFNNVLSASKACRDSQKAYFAARKAGLSGHKELNDSKSAEKILDDLTKFWMGEMAPPTEQTSLF